MLRLVVFLYLTIFILSIDCRNQSIDFLKPSLCIDSNYVIPLFGTRIVNISFNRTRLEQLNIHTISIHNSIADRQVAEFSNHHHTINKIYHLNNDTEEYGNQPLIVYSLKIQANYINRTDIHYFIETISKENLIYHINCSVILMVVPPRRIIDKIFRTSLPCIIMITSIQMGMLLDIAILKELIQRPTQILIGFICQYGFMPLIAYSISKMFHYSPLYGLGLFVVGCCPGGSVSNQWTVIFDGDLNLSAFMSFASTVASFFMMPFWLYTLGQYSYLRHLKIRVPFFNLALTLLTVIGPLAVGMLIVHFVPKLKQIMKRIVKPTLILIIFYFFVFGAFVNYYLFRYLDLTTALTAPFLPWLGFLLGGFFAYICKQDWQRVITIGIETGIQNVGIAFMVLYYCFPAPENSQAGAIPLIVAYLSAQPFHIILIYQLIRRKCCKPVLPSSELDERTPEVQKSSLPVLLLGQSPNCNLSETE